MQTEGFLKALNRFDSKIQVPDYSTIDRRVNQLELKLSDEESYGNDIVIAVDASGIKVANRGDWIRRRWKVRRGFLKIQIAVDTKAKRKMALDVTSEKIGDGKRVKKLVDEAFRKVKVNKVLADGAYDSKRNFHYLAAKGTSQSSRCGETHPPGRTAACPGSS
jgi:IS5 family transposase